MTPGSAAPLTESDDRQWASFAHLGGILGILPALIIWLVFKDRGSFTNAEGKEATNFQITVIIGWVALSIVTSVLSAITFGIFGFFAWVFFLALWVVSVVFSIQGFLKAKDGIGYRYPFALRLIK
jgi:uncharacterized Tic20 family protein